MSEVKVEYILNRKMSELGEEFGIQEAISKVMVTRREMVSSRVDPFICRREKARREIKELIDGKPLILEWETPLKECKEFGAVECEYKALFFESEGHRLIVIRTLTAGAQLALCMKLKKWAGMEFLNREQLAMDSLAVTREARRMHELLGG